MTLTGFRSQNHPQQTGARGALDEVDDRGTDPEYIKSLEERFDQPFTLDVAAAPHNAKAPRYFTRSDDGLAQSWASERVWCNPPYSNIGDWVRKAWNEQHESRGIVMLLPANRTEQKWWQEEVEPFRSDPVYKFHVEFLPGRMRFSRPDAVIGPKGDRPPFGCVLLIWEAPTEKTGRLPLSGMTTSRDIPSIHPVAYGIYGRVTGNLKCVEPWDEDAARDQSEFYDVRPLYLREPVTDAQVEAARQAWREADRKGLVGGRLRAAIEAANDATPEP